MKAGVSTETVCIVSHDAGGAEILACYAAQNALRCRLVLEGPALAVFEQHMRPVRVERLSTAIAASDWCLFGTSWQSDLEWHAIDVARNAGKRTVSFLDHWVNYPDRFIRNGVRHLPDEIWVGDEDAKTLAEDTFPELPIKLVPNPYFAYIERQIARYAVQSKARLPSKAQVLFVCENLSGHGALRFGNARHFGYTEIDAIEYFFSRIADLGPSIERVIVRPHPSDPPQKYSATIAEHSPLAVLGGDRPLLEEIAEADIIAGCESAALIAASIAGKRVVSCVPPDAKVAFIDRRRGIEMLRDLSASAARST